jgi:hypothetical protein
MENGNLLVSQYVLRIYAPAVKEATPGEKRSFAVNLRARSFLHYPFSILLHMWRRRMEFSIFREWALRLSRRACMPRPYSLKIENGKKEV